jgi:hypothetical protein
MFWIALSALIMSLTGAGDDTFAIRKFLERMKAAVATQVSDPGRQHAALATLERTSKAFTQHRERVGKISACIEQSDRVHAATAADYEACLADVTRTWDDAAEQLVILDRAFRAALTPVEIEAVRQAAKKQ